jgi:hypothetical protein
MKAVLVLGSAITTPQKRMTHGKLIITRLRRALEDPSSIYRGSRRVMVTLLSHTARVVICVRRSSMPSLGPNPPSPRVTDIGACGDSRVEPLTRHGDLAFRPEEQRDRADDERVVRALLHGPRCGPCVADALPPGSPSTTARPSLSTPAAHAQVAPFLRGRARPLAPRPRPPPHTARRSSGLATALFSINARVGMLFPSASSSGSQAPRA